MMRPCKSCSTDRKSLFLNDGVKFNTSIEHLFESNRLCESEALKCALNVRTKSYEWSIDLWLFKKFTQFVKS